MPSLNTGFLWSHSERLRFFIRMISSSSRRWMQTKTIWYFKRKLFIIRFYWDCIYPLAFPVPTFALCPCVSMCCFCGLDRRNHQIYSLQFIRIQLLNAMENFSDYLWADGNKRKTSQGFLGYFPFLFTSQLQNMAIDFSSQQETKDFISRPWL